MHRFGLFAASAIKKGTSLGYYKGEIMNESDPNNNSDYSLELSERPPWISKKDWRTKGPFVDPLTWPKMWLKYVNSADEDNDANLDLTPQGEYVANRDIAVGEELFIDHGIFLDTPACDVPCGHMFCADVRAGQF